MKKILGWAIALVAIEAVVYFGALYFDFPVGIARLFTFIVSFYLIFMIGIPAISFAAAPAFVTATLFSFATLLSTAGLAVTLGILVFVSTISGGLKMKYRYVFLASLIEGGGIYGTVALSAWWPALAAVTILGTWYTILHHNERKLLVTAG